MQTSSRKSTWARNLQLGLPDYARNTDPLSAIGREDELVCWTRMQTEAGEPIEAIVARKEKERQAGQGTFFWGVGNAPALATPAIASQQLPVTVIFSIMKTKPKAIDRNPASLLIWRRYFDMTGALRPLPPFALITSRGTSGDRKKARHYALMCYSHRPLVIEHGNHFDPSVYRNVGVNGGPIGASQVTALVRRIGRPAQGPYHVNFAAQLTGSYWVKLDDPVPVDADAAALVGKFSPVEAWPEAVSSLRKGGPVADRPHQPSLL